MIELLTEWIESIRVTYGVNPYIFAGIYIGAIPIFWVGVYWLAKNLKNKKRLSGPILLMMGCAVSSYVYLLIAGENIPLWVYAIIVIMIIYALFEVRKQAVRKKQEVASEI